MIIEYMPYVIFFQNPVEYNFAVSLTGGSGIIQISPRGAATLFGIPFPYPSGDIDTIPKGIYFPSVFTPGAAITWGPNPTGFTADDSLNSVGPVPSQAGIPASTWPADSPAKDGLFIWSGVIVPSRGAGSSLNPPLTPFAQRRFCMGFEWSLMHEGSGTSEIANTSRDASRTIDGKGMCIRGQNFGFINVTVNCIRTALVTNTSWERFYIRCRKVPAAADTQFWRTHGTTAPLAGFGLRYTNAGTIRGANISAAGVETDQGIIWSPIINQWYRVDIFLKYATGLGTDGRIVIFVDGTQVFSFTNGAGVGLNEAANHSSTDFGNVSASGGQEVEIDLDDWIQADLPGNINSLTLVSGANPTIDFLLGSHVRAHFSRSGSFTNWAPNAFGNLNQGVNPIQHQTGEEVSTMSGATMEGLTDAPLQSEPDTIANVLGAVAATIGSYQRNSGGTDGKLGYRIAGAAAVFTTIDQLAGNTIKFIGYQPSALILPEEISPFSVTHTKSTDGNTDTTTDLVSVVEYIGVWGPEDDPLFNFPMSRLTFIHNAPYPNSEFGYVGSAAPFPVIIKAGTYVGNGTTTTIPLPGPANWIWLRCTDGGGNGTIIWFSTMLGVMFTNARATMPDMRAYCDSATGNFFFEVTGANNVLNQSAKTYQYIAFIDPGMRFMVNGVYSHGLTSITPKVNSLIETGFLAEAGFVTPASINTLAGGTERPVYKGPGIALNRARPLDASAVLTNFMNFGIGVLNTLADAHQGFANMCYNLWKTTDGGGCSGVMVQIFQYTGNGAGSQVVSMTPVSGRVPVFVMVQPDGALNGFFRDPSHAGANSSFITNNGLSATAITAVGVDSITVGASLNTNLQVYSVFALPGDTAGMVNGTYQSQYCAAPPGGPWIPPTAPLGNINVIGDGGLQFNGAVPLLLLKDISGIYTLIPDKLNDTLMDRQTGQTSVDVPILPIAKTGYIGG